MNKYFVYILECSDGSYYTGSTNDVEKRVIRHNLGRGSKYIRSRLPAKLLYSEGFETRSEALKRELAIKKLTREAKSLLITLRA